MKWIKASDRLPEFFDKHWKLNGLPTTAGNAFRLVKLNSVEGLEWLDESLPTHRSDPDDKDREIERLKGLIERCKPYIAELQQENWHEPNVGILYDQPLSNLFDQLNNL